MSTKPIPEWRELQRLQIDRPLCQLVSKEHIWFNSATIEMASLIVLLVSIYALKLQRKLGRQIVPSSSLTLQKQNITTVESSVSRRSSNGQRIVLGLKFD